MTQEENDLLLKDLCERLPYGVLIQEKCLEDDKMFLPDEETDKLININVSDGILMTNGGSFYHIDEIKPYLFPLSSMAEEQKEQYYTLADDVTIKPGKDSHFGIKIHCIKLGISDNPHEGLWDSINLDAINWLLKNKFDIYGLIPMGLAIDATELDVY